jgi:hypothetical protein
MASAVRCPKSASNTAANASLRPVRRPRTRSAPDAIDQDGHRSEVQAEQPFHCRRYRRPDLACERPKLLAGAGHDPETDEDAIVADLHGNGRPTQDPAPRGPTAPDPGNAWYLERCQPDQFGDDAPPDRQFRPVHDASRPAAAD